MRFLFLLAASLLFVESAAAGWFDAGGQRIEGRPVEFDFASKELRFEQADGATAGRPTSELSFRSRQRLFLSPLFLESLPGSDFSNPERRHYLFVLVLTPAVFLLAGFWIAAMLLARKAHPLRALAGFLGSWIIGTLFVVFYVYFAHRFGGGFKTTLVGVAMGLVALAFLISAIYHCTVFKGLLIFLAQGFAGGFLFLVTLAFSEAVFGESTVSHFWEERVFIPTGLMPPFEAVEAVEAVQNQPRPHRNGER